MTSSTASSPATADKHNAPPEPRIRFRLTGKSRPFDVRHQAIRPDLADVAEASHHFAPHYAEAARWQAKRSAPVLAKPAATAEQHATLDAGSGFDLLDLTGGWAWGKTVPGNIVGYVEASALEPTS